MYTVVLTRLNKFLQYTIAKIAIESVVGSSVLEVEPRWCQLIGASYCISFAPLRLFCAYFARSFNSSLSLSFLGIRCAAAPQRRNGGFFANFAQNIWRHTFLTSMRYYDVNSKNIFSSSRFHVAPQRDCGAARILRDFLKFVYDYYDPPPML